jgi:hypothetical protein
VSIEGLSDKQLKMRKVFATKYNDSIVSESEKILQYIQTITDSMTTNPAMNNVTYDTMTDTELGESKNIFEHLFVRSSKIPNTMRNQLELIDKEIMKRQSL